MKKPLMPGLLVQVLLFHCVISLAQEKKSAPETVLPSFTDVSYGEHEKELINFWQSGSDLPLGVLLEIHGGGWMGGKKKERMRAEHLHPGYHFASISYPLVNEGAQQPAMLNAALRAVQFLRYKAEDWNIDPERIVVTGGSAGGCSSLLVALHDDVANPQSNDPVEHFSSRVAGASVAGAQTTLDPFVIKERIGEKTFGNPMPYKPFGAETAEELMTHWGKYKDLVLECSPLSHVSKDDPPIYLFYNKDRIVPAPDSPNGIHSPVFGEIMLETCKEHGVECQLQYWEKDRPKPAVSQQQFLDRLLLQPERSPGKTQAEGPSGEAQTFFELLKNSNTIVEDIQGNEISPNKIAIEREWTGNICRTKLKNTSDELLQPKDVILFNIPKHGLDPDSPIYGEGFQMLYQNGGTLRKRENIGNHPDNKHYKIPDLHGLPTAYGLLNVNYKEDENLLLGFTTCKRFIGRISFDSLQMLISIDAEGLTLHPGESWELEDFMLEAGETQGELYDLLAAEINKNHPARRTENIPTGWCSWYCYRLEITDELMIDNLDIFSEKMPELEYIQLDDGYQPFMGDWLDPNPSYGNVRLTIDAIRERGFEPAIWVAPFIAQKESRVFREHPDWFVKNREGQPLNSATVSFGGWRHGPWYCLDGTHPEVQEHFKHIFRVMREEWGVNYFKLDANYWGAIQEGVHFVENASRIEAYRQGMEAILSGCDENTVVLGCNSPIWPSFGLVTAQRTSGDIRRSWKSFKSLAKQNLSRCWQNGNLWDSDPDCIVLTTDSPWNTKGNVTENEWIFHATSIHAVGGLILSGDKAELLYDKELAILKKLLEPTGKGASFINSKMETGITDLGDKQYYYFFNWGEEPIDLQVRLKTRSRLMDFWTDEDLGVHEGAYSVSNLAPHSARLILASNELHDNDSKVITHQTVVDEALSEEYVVTVNGKNVPVYTAALSYHYPDSPLQMDDSYAFASFGCSGPVKVIIRSQEPLKQFSVRSASESIPVEIRGNEANFTLGKNGNFLIERNGNGRRDPLLLFANPPDTNVPDKNDPDVIYFGAGRHHAGLISLSSNQTLYIDAGAIVTGRVEARGQNIRICGQGILENSGEDYKWTHMILLDSCTNVSIEGIIMRKNSRGWTLVPRNCDDVRISNVKICGSHSFNDDGIDPVNSQNVLIENCLIRTNDDCLAFKGMAENRSNCENITVRHCIMWSDQCCTILLGDECQAAFMRNIEIRECLVPYLSYEGYPKKFLMMHSGEEMRMENIRIEDIAIGGEGQDKNYMEITTEFNKYSKIKTAGHIQGVLLKNVHLTGQEGGYQIVIRGYDQKHRIKSVTFENCFINGKLITDAYPGLEIGEFTKKIRFTAGQNSDRN